MKCIRPNITLCQQTLRVRYTGRTLECQITLRNHVCCQEQDTLIVFQLPQENRHQRVSYDIIATPLVKEHIRLVEQKHSFPCLRELQDLNERFVNGLGVCAQFTC